jgi:hypothetical protein
MGYQVVIGPRVRHIEKLFYWSWNYFFRFVFFAVCIVATAPIWLLVLCGLLVTKDDQIAQIRKDRDAWREHYFTMRDGQTVKVHVKGGQTPGPMKPPPPRTGPAKDPSHFYHYED